MASRFTRSRHLLPASVYWTPPSAARSSWLVTNAEVLSYLRRRLPKVQPKGAPQRLPEGNLNVVWRVPGAPSVIVKHAPPYVAAQPDVTLDPSRLAIEAACLRAFDADGPLRDLATPLVRPPHLLDVNLAQHVLVMEDVGDVPTLGRWLRTAPSAALQRSQTIGERLGRFLGQLHRRTLHDTDLRERFDNRPMQQTRHAVQYQAVGDLLREAGIPDAEALGQRAKALGEYLLTPGRCLTMGDLWPPSVLVRPTTLRLIDWELAHVGQPEQDVAHFEAHCWMQAHRAPHPDAKRAVQTLQTSFRTSYRAAVDDAAGTLLSDAMQQRGAVHVGAEILVRTVGGFQDGYLYEGLPSAHPDVQEAVQAAAQCIRTQSLNGL